MKKLQQPNHIEKETAEIGLGGYENLSVSCPYCDQYLIFNRISELKTVMSITGKDLLCYHCNKVFWATGDEVTAAKYKWFLQDLYFLKKEKKYGLYILALCQACEMFMHQAIVNKMVDCNYRDKASNFTEDYNVIYSEFCNQTIKDISNSEIRNDGKYEKVTFKLLRELFLHIFKDARNNKLPSLSKLKEDKRGEYFNVLEKTEINETRNKVVHKYAYRPSVSDVEKYDELISCLHWLSVYLNVQDSELFINKRL